MSEKKEHPSTTYNRGVVQDYGQREAEAKTPESKAYWNGVKNTAANRAATEAAKHGDKL